MKALGGCVGFVSVWKQECFKVLLLGTQTFLFQKHSTLGRSRLTTRVPDPVSELERSGPRGQWVPTLLSLILWHHLHEEKLCPSHFCPFCKEFTIDGGSRLLSLTALPWFHRAEVGAIFSLNQMEGCSRLFLRGAPTSSQIVMWILISYECLGFFVASFCSLT